MDTHEHSGGGIGHGDLAALLCIDQEPIRAFVEEQLGTLGFGCMSVVIPEEAALRLQERVYEVIVIHEHFGSMDVESNPALHLLRELSLSQRRGAFAILIGPGMESHSVMQAFLHGVDLTLNDADYPDFRTLAGRGIVAQENRYSAFNAVLKRVQER